MVCGEYFVSAVRTWNRSRQVDEGIVLGKGYATSFDHVGVYLKPAHAGMAKPHYRIVLWHVPSPKSLRLRSNRIAPPAAMENPMAVTLL